jgi:hypothetical protein
MRTTVLFHERPRSVQVVLTGIVPALLGAFAGILLGVSSAAYWAVGAVAAIGALVAGFEHRDGWEGARRGFISGAIYGAALLIAHALAGTHAKVSLGSFPPLLILITAIIGTALTGGGGRLARARRETRGAAPATD